MAAAAGVRYVDAARSYGLAEQFLAGWLARAEPAPFVASKWGYAYTAGWRADAAQHEVKDHGLTTFERQFAESEALLRPWLRLYQVHSLTVESPLWADRALHHRLAALRDSGLEVGFSTSGAAQAEAIRRGLDLSVDGIRLFDSVQTTWNLLERSAGDALAEAHAAGLRVVVKEALANGRLTGAAGQLGQLPRPRNEAGQLGRLRDEAGRLGVGVDAVALAAALAQPWCDVVLSGAVTVAQLHSNLAALQVVGEIDPAELLNPETPQEYWAARSRLPWS